MRYPVGDGRFAYLMLFPNGVRIDLTIDFRKYVHNGEPAAILPDKDNGKGFLPASCLSASVVGLRNCNKCFAFFRKHMVNDIIDDHRAYRLAYDSQRSCGH